jgi:hypothetical protein
MDTGMAYGVTRFHPFVSGLKNSEY